MSSNPFGDSGYNPNPYQAPAYGYGMPGDMGDREYALAKVQAPAICLMVFAGVFGAIQLLAVALNLLGVGVMAAGAANNGDAAANMIQGVVGIISSIVGCIVSVVIGYGGFKMKNLETHALAMTASVLAAVPCISPCCIFGLPLGIWCITVLNDQQVKMHFR